MLVVSGRTTQKPRRHQKHVVVLEHRRGTAIMTDPTTPTTDERVSRLEETMRVLGLQRMAGKSLDELAAAGGFSTASTGCTLHSSISLFCLDQGREARV